jgi:ferredoxin
MERGKKTCKILKDIRQQIAQQNDIEFITSACKHKGDCAGTCPKCEAEVAYLERQLEERRRLGKIAKVAGIAASVTLTIASCTPITNPETETKQPEEQLQGDPVEPNDTGSEDGGEALGGDPAE